MARRGLANKLGGMTLIFSATGLRGPHWHVRLNPIWDY